MNTISRHKKSENFQLQFDFQGLTLYNYWCVDVLIHVSVE